MVDMISTVVFFFFLATIIYKCISFLTFFLSRVHTKYFNEMSPTWIQQFHLDCFFPYFLHTFDEQNWNQLFVLFNQLVIDSEHCSNVNINNSRFASVWRQLCWLLCVTYTYKTRAYTHTLSSSDVVFIWDFQINDSSSISLCVCSSFSFSPTLTLMRCTTFAFSHNKF